MLTRVVFGCLALGLAWIAWQGWTSPHAKPTAPLHWVETFWRAMAILAASFAALLCGVIAILDRVPDWIGTGG
jgi:hypothetical protein